MTSLYKPITLILEFYYMSNSPLYTNSRTHLYPESTTLITEIEATWVQLRPETYIELSIALGHDLKMACANF